ncbi:MAG: hypothetical protein PHV28_03945 [Kiritimatiellae bacterium]|nr:hypothetical protein [Kiritimatiellia bacterium]
MAVVVRRVPLTLALPVCTEEGGAGGENDRPAPVFCAKGVGVTTVRLSDGARERGVPLLPGFAVAGRVVRYADDAAAGVWLPKMRPETGRSTVAAGVWERGAADAVAGRVEKMRPETGRSAEAAGVWERGAAGAVFARAATVAGLSQLRALPEALYVAGREPVWPPAFDRKLGDTVCRG